MDPTRWQALLKMPWATFQALAKQIPVLQAEEVLRQAKAQWFPYLSGEDRQAVLDAAAGKDTEMSGWDSEGLRLAAETLGTPTGTGT